jgi:hypothetical protein
MKNFSILFTLFIFFQTEVCGQDWSQIATKGQSDIDVIANPIKFSQNGVIWDIKFEPNFNTVLNLLCLSERS